MTFYGIVKAVQKDDRGYITYVFELPNSEEYNILKFKNITCTRVPNWETRLINVGDCGYVEVDIKKAGIDCWYNGKELIPYNYNFTQFISFINPGASITKTCIM